MLTALGAGAGFPAVGATPLAQKTESLECREAAYLREFDLNINTRGKIELHQRVDRLRGGLNDVQHPLIGANLELLARLLVDVRATVHGELLDARRQRDRTTDERAGAASGLGDVAGRLIKHAMIERLQANADVVVHIPTNAKERGRSLNRHASERRGDG